MRVRGCRRTCHRTQGEGRRGCARCRRRELAALLGVLRLCGFPCGLGTVPDSDVGSPWDCHGYIHPAHCTQGELTGEL